MRAIVRGEYDDGVFVDIKVFQGLQNIPDTMINAGDGGSKSFGYIRHTLTRIIGITIMIDGSLCRIYHFAGLPQPFESALYPFSIGIGNRRQLQRGVRGIVSQIHKEWALGMIFSFIHYHLFSFGGP